MACRLYGKLQNESDEKENSGKTTEVIAADVEFFNMLEGMLSEGSVLSMSALRDTYSKILQANGVKESNTHSTMLKRKIVKNIEDVQFSKPKRKNESERVFSSVARDAAIDKAIDSETDLEQNMKTVFDCAKIVRKSMTKALVHPWVFQGSLENADVDASLPAELYTLIRWIL